MAAQTRIAFKTHFEIGKRPIREQFADLVDFKPDKTNDSPNISPANDISNKEIRDILPELVYGDQKGMLSLNYIPLIPILVETYKALDEKYRHLQEPYQACTILVKHNV